MKTNAMGLKMGLNKQDWMKSNAIGLKLDLKETRPDENECDGVNAGLVRK